MAWNQIDGNHFSAIAASSNTDGKRAIASYLLHTDASHNVANPDQMFTLPTCKISDNFSDYSFVVGGLVLSLLIGERLPRGLDRACLLHAAPKKYAVRRPSDLGGVMHEVIMTIATADLSPR